MIQADLGDVEQLKVVELQDHDYIHIRRRMVTQGDDQVLVAGESIRIHLVEPPKTSMSHLEYCM